MSIITRAATILCLSAGLVALSGCANDCNTCDTDGDAVALQASMSETSTCAEGQCSAEKAAQCSAEKAATCSTEKAAQCSTEKAATCELKKDATCEMKSGCADCKDASKCAACVAH